MLARDIGRSRHESGAELLEGGCCGEDTVWWVEQLQPVGSGRVRRGQEGIRPESR